MCTKGAQQRDERRGCAFAAYAPRALCLRRLAARKARGACPRLARRARFCTQRRRPINVNKEVVMTYAGLRALEDELENLMTVKR